MTGYCMRADDRNHFFFDQLHDPLEERPMFRCVALQPLDELLPCVECQLAGDGDVPNAVEDLWAELQGALIGELVQNVLLDLVQVTFGIDEMKMEELLQ